MQPVTAFFLVATTLALSRPLTKRVLYQLSYISFFTIAGADDRD